MTTETEIVNAALRKVGAKRIGDITDSVPNAGVAQDVLSQERDDALRAGLWNFAVTRRKLAQLSTTPVFGFAYAYTMPADCFRLISVHDNDAGTGFIPYKLETIEQDDGSFVYALLCDSADVYIRYCRQVTDVSLWHPSFKQVVILRMAKIFAICSAKSNALAQDMKDELKDALRSARSIDAMEDFPEERPEGSWATSRRGYGWASGNTGWPFR